MDLTSYILERTAGRDLHHEVEGGSLVSTLSLVINAYVRVIDSSDPLPRRALFVALGGESVCHKQIYEAHPRQWSELFLLGTFSSVPSPLQ